MLERYWQESHLVSADKAMHRFSDGRIPEALIPECNQSINLAIW
ncbi:hypothetical protein POHY109586_15905 [Polaromonas hydrogenivorans]